MKNLNRSWTLFVVLCALPGMAVAQQQEQQSETQNQPSRRGPREPQETRVFVLRNLHVHEMSRMISQTYGVRVASVERSNSIVVRASNTELEEIAVLVEQMEKQQQGKPAGAGPQIVEIRHRAPEDIASVLSDMNLEVYVVADPESGKLVLSGPEVSSALKVVAELDTVRDEHRTLSPSLSVTIDIIRGTAGSKDKGNLPEHLKAVERALVSQGIGGLELFGHLMARSLENAHFEGNGVVRPMGSQETSYIRARGQASVYEGRAELDIQTTVQVPRPAQPGGEDVTRRISYEDLSLETTTVVPLGDYLVLGAMPSRIEESDTILIVIRVTMD